MSSAYNPYELTKMGNLVGGTYAAYFICLCYVYIYTCTVVRF